MSCYGPLFSRWETKILYIWVTQQVLTIHKWPVQDLNPGLLTSAMLLTNNIFLFLTLSRMSLPSLLHAQILLTLEGSAKMLHPHNTCLELCLFKISYHTSLENYSKIKYTNSAQNNTALCVIWLIIISEIESRAIYSKYFLKCKKVFTVIL